MGETFVFGLQVTPGLNVQKVTIRKWRLVNPPYLENFMKKYIILIAFVGSYIAGLSFGLPSYIVGGME